MSWRARSAGGLSTAVLLLFHVCDLPVVVAGRSMRRQGHQAAAHSAVQAEAATPGPSRRIVFTLTTKPDRIAFIRPVLEAVVEKQSRPPDAVFLSVGPTTVVPEWLAAYEKEHPAGSRTELRVLKHASDPGPGLKLIGAARAELHAGNSDTLIVFGDDDVKYGEDIVKLHASHPHIDEHGNFQAWGPRLIKAGYPEIPVLEATGTISLLARAVPPRAFTIGEMPASCRFSDDYFLAYALHEANVTLNNLAECEMNWSTQKMDTACELEDMEEVRSIAPLSSLALDAKGQPAGFNADWTMQLERYKECGRHLSGLNAGKP